MLDPSYHDFMIELLTKLEPIKINFGKIIRNELDEFGELTFVTHGSIGIGYELNRIKKIVLQYRESGEMGSFETTFNHRSEFVYVATSDIRGYFVRKNVWSDLL